MYKRQDKNSAEILSFLQMDVSQVSSITDRYTVLSVSSVSYTHLPQMKKENMLANRPFLEVLSQMAAKKNATNAQISLAWMLHKYPHVAPIPGSKNKERILENLGAWKVKLTDEEFQELEEALDRIPIHGQRQDRGAKTEFFD